MRNHQIIISLGDHERLLALINSARLDWRIPSEHVLALEGELARATLVEDDALPHSVVAMHSNVWFRDLDTQEDEEYTLVYPAEADVTCNLISVLAPIGTALLGYRVGDVLKWRVPLGTRRLKIVNVVQRKLAEPAAAAFA
jgi:regulator of nucleoside diphosphate kinase